MEREQVLELEDFVVERNKRSGKRRKWVWITFIIIFLLLLGVGIYSYSFYSSMTSAVNTMHKPIERELSEKRVEEVELEAKDPLTVLLLGVDEREGDSGRSDTIIVLTVNPEEESVKMLSIPRDTRTTIIGQNIEDKINHAYAFGGVDMSISTVEDFLDIPIDYYIQVNMEGFMDIVDALGGVTIYNDMEFQSGSFTFPQGELTLDGEKALAYSRMRYEDPRGDFGRQDRQRQIIQAVMKEGASFSSLTKYRDIFEVLGKNVRTNLTFQEMVDIQKHYKTAVNQVEQLQISGEGQLINSIYYYIVPEEEKTRIQTEFQTHLNLPTDISSSQVPGTSD
jgi:polyisoprenyl-teichoic acid--peptidoglycan teichoic acid transferase